MQKEEEIGIPQEHQTEDAVGTHVIPSTLVLNSKIQLENRIRTCNY